MNEVSVSDGNVMTRSSQTEMMISRQAQEVQAAMVIAKKFPRDEYEASGLNCLVDMKMRTKDVIMKNRISKCHQNVATT